ncbi:hypothetical protein [Chitinophaga horti]
MSREKYLYKGKFAPGRDTTETSVSKETGETRKILGYECRKVVATRGKTVVTYWYTTAIPALGSPFGAMSDKGVVLQMDSEPLSFKADEVRFRKVAASEVAEPTGLPVIYEKEYAELKGQ